MAVISHGRARLLQATELLHAILTQPQYPADSAMDHYFSTHRKMGSKDRAFAAEAVYGCLRHKRELEALHAPVYKPELEKDKTHWLVAAWLLKYGGWSARALADAGFNGTAVALVERIRALDLFGFPLAVRANLPDWLTEKLTREFGEEETLKLADALNQPASVDIRVNALKTGREALQTRLKEEGYELIPTPYSPFGLRRAKRGPLFTTEAFRNGWFELQDEGSQLVGLLVEAQPKQKIADFCAGAGGKTLQLAATMSNTGALYACDASARRLDRLKPRLKRAGIDTIQRLTIRDEHDRKLVPLHGKMDTVLVDAPCSGTGTLRRNPDIKWKNIDLDELQGVQRSILDAASRLTKPGGRLVYATCSLLDEENDVVVTAFLDSHLDFYMISAQEVLVRQGVNLKDGFTGNGAMRLLPHRHGTDGFYAAVLVRR
ncbi:MAG: RsmB/NOP family class I SAM-dependent RNA methyltransferase [Gammaproteobacteria bacterium]